MIIRILYNAVYLFAAFSALVVFAASRPARFFRELAASFLPRICSRAIAPSPLPVIIVRCASLGETKVAEKFISRLAGYRTVLAVGTLSAYEYARAARFADDVVFTPLDFFVFTKIFFARLRPSVVALVESDLWPEFLWSAKAAGAGVCLVNGRFSPSTAALAKRFPGLALAVLEDVDFFLVRYASDASALSALGVNPGKVETAGNAKYDFAAPPPSSPRRSLGYLPDDFVIVAGSTHREDETALAAALGNLFVSCAPVKIVIVPRHVERAPETAGIFEDYKPTLLSSAQDLSSASAPRCLIVDSIGKLEKYYSVCDIAFIGGSFGRRGGQEPMTPAYFSKPVIYGPGMTKFADETARLETAGGAVKVVSAKDLAAAFERFAANPADGRSVGARAKSATSFDAGAAARIAERLLAMAAK